MAVPSGSKTLLAVSVALALFWSPTESFLGSPVATCKRVYGARGSPKIEAIDCLNIKQDFLFSRGSVLAAGKPNEDDGEKTPSKQGNQLNGVIGFFALYLLGFLALKATICPLEDPGEFWMNWCARM
ncbi:unnamed protein product [Heterosigma akashiwo]|mmetsp:Transcript_5995/g.10677  ORF Transcript_5995/g.10677 Transcript_5995/m.10677 type:complete len:127 (+) Transcript_5995:63-443(+)|eukprot:CAMPEP_0194569936 /NCGR_PEP_ID=MMETSP0292-20121207/7447_1 /TAXON_ID=39354 /ORGANISM="Heterosigma akashiwo, Strain CCMP2393" /LENGTH=126 /DNA_ID=CAMNT_0039420275 /DNA_START=63 /DNA_END=443 /DNA_ORIENTATION=-